MNDWKFGSSPRARGTEQASAEVMKSLRFIPACAGNSMDVNYLSFQHAVHPRVRGEQLKGFASPSQLYGSSPRARGTGSRLPWPGGRRRFIPACAGNRLYAMAAACFGSVHPRVRGEQVPASQWDVGMVGSSPRARGTENAALGKRLIKRFIPACAGNRCSDSAVEPRWSVHPRVRGEQ